MKLSDEEMALVRSVARERRKANGKSPNWNIGEEELGVAAEVAMVKALGLNPFTWPFVMPIEEFREARENGWKDVGSVEVKAFTPGHRRSIIVPSKAADNVPYVGAEVNLEEKTVVFKGWVLPEDKEVWGLEPEIRRADFTVGNYFFNINGPVRQMADLVVEIPDELYFRHKT